MPPPAVKRTRLVASLALAMIVALVGLGAQTLFRDSFGNLSYDSLHSLAERNFDDSRVVIVYLDIASFLAEHRDPAERWPRDLHARLLNQLTSAGAKAVIFDIIFDSPGGSSSADAEFTEALRRNGRCILAGDHSSKNSHQISSGAEWARLTKLQPPAEEFADAAADWGIAQLWVDDDFVVRRHIGRFQTDHATSLSAAAARMLGIPPAQPPSGVLWMRYYGPALTIPHVSYSEALNPRELPENFFRDKIVFIGARPIEGLMDERRDEFRSPFHSWSHKEYFMPGVEVHATQMLNLLRGDGLQRLSPGAEAAWLLLVAALFGGGLIRLRPVPATVVALAGAGLALGVSAMAFLRGVWFPWAIASGAQIPAALFGSWLYQFQDWFFTRRKLEAAKKVADAKIREQAALIEKAHDAILVRELGGKIIYANPSVEKLCGWRLEEMQREDVLEQLFSPDPGAAEAARTATLNTGEWNGELHLQNRSGQIVIVASRWTLIRDDLNRPQALLLINSDITEQKNLEQQFLRTQRMNTIGSLAGGMAHDLNNALAPVLLGAQLLRRKAKDEEDRNLLSLIESSVTRGGEMVRQVLLFARGRGGEFERLELAPIVKELEKMVRETFPKSIAVETFLPVDLWAVHGNQTQLHQVLLNLCVNARDAMPGGGKISFAADNVTLGAKEAAEIPGAGEGDYVSLLVSDTGTGMSAEVRAKIFEPFFTTKGEGQGTGIGLSTVMRIVKAHGGCLRVESAPGEGTTFDILLPRAADGVRTDVEGPTEIPRGHGELILIVDDEQAARQLVSESLVSQGYRVLAAAGGEEAIRLFTRHQAEIRLLLTDSAMPDMNGRETVAAIRRKNPALPVILASAEADTEGEFSKPPSAVLQKPFSLDELMTTVHEALTRD